MTKKAFTRKASEYIHKKDFKNKELNDYYEKFERELFDNNLSKSLDRIHTQLHNTNELINKVYSQANSRERDLVSNLRATGHLEQEVDSNTPFYKEEKYSHLLKTHGYNYTLKELFEDYSLMNLEVNTLHDSLQLLKHFYVEISKLNREERKFKKKDSQITKEYNEPTT